MHFSGMKFELYHPLHVQIHYRGGNQPEYNLNIDVDYYDPSPRYQLETVEVFLMKAGQRVREVEIETREDPSHHFYHKNIPVNEEEYDEILLRFGYDSGEVFERSVEVSKQ